MHVILLVLAANEIRKHDDFDGLRTSSVWTAYQQSNYAVQNLLVPTVSVAKLSESVATLPAPVRRAPVR